MTDTNEKYKTILDNLLEIESRDPSVYTNIDDKLYFDIFKLFGPRWYESITKSKEFSHPLREINLLQLLNELRNVKTPEEVFKLFNDYELILSDKNKKLLKVDFKEGIKKISDQITVNFQKSTLKWKLFLNHANEINNEMNVWTIHLGFMYVSLVINERSVYAPLFLKEATIKFKNGIPYLVCDGEIKINEKLQFVLNNAGFNIKIDFDLSDYTIDQLVQRLYKEWRLLYNIKQDISGPFIIKKIDDITNQTLEFYPGIVLGIFSPEGGYSRNRMKEIIDNDEVDSIFKVKFDKRLYKKFVDDNIHNEKVDLLKITPTNYSQDKAIISSLQQHTIIWGPPGTGKSQTIVNLLVNIINYKKTVIVASQKKAALDVIRNRLGILNDFCIFISKYDKKSKKDFFASANRLIDFLEVDEYEKSANMKILKTIKPKEKKWVDTLEEYLNNPAYNEILEGYFYLFNNIDKLDDENIKFVFDLPKNVLYPEDIIRPRMDKILLKLNKVFPLPFLKKYKNIKALGKKINDGFSHFTGNIAQLVIKFRNINPENIKWVNNFLDLMPDFEEEEISNIESIKINIGRIIRKKILNFSPETLSRYTNFTSLIRIKKIQPYKLIKEFPDIIKALFPVVIATPYSDLSIWEREEFDYAIIDESSQIFIEQGLPLLYLSKTKILAGDKMQMSPTNWFGVRTTDDSVFGSVKSVLDYVESLKIYSIILDKNYRSNNAALMTFSSKYFYNSSLDVVDSADSYHNETPIEVIQVEDGKWEDNRNIQEAEIALKLLEENLDKYQKIILLAFNAKQKEYLTNEIYNNHKEIAEFLDTKILLRNIENIQGDEADLVIASVAYDKNTKISSTYVAREGGKNALNVAISRAKDKIIVIKTLKANELNITFENGNDVNIFKKWLEFLELSADERKNYVKSKIDDKKQSDDSEEIDENSDLTINNIEKELKNKVKNDSEIKIVKNFSVGTLKIDLVALVQGNIYKCFIVDTYKYTNNYEKYSIFKDNYRFLKEKNYSPVYLNSIIWIKNKDKILADFDVNEINIFKNKLLSIKTKKVEEKP